MHGNVVEIGTLTSEQNMTFNTFRAQCKHCRFLTICTLLFKFKLITH